MRQMIPEYIRHTRKTGFQAVHAAKPFIVEHHIFLAEAPFFPKRGNQLWCTSKQQAKRQFKTGDVIHIQQGNTQPFFWSGLCQPTLLQNILPLPAKAWRFIPFGKRVFIRQIVNSCTHTEEHSV
ncbi:hypothetical protein HMPREF9533_05001 [Escherichia coli MS 60-1]|nr:hypothetical protein HMPREF9533_05001 [Escherichia coli MS 60-1]ESE31895.1 hypothetical protein HMPREF1622_03576 [Escherichia coli A35218R]